MICKVENGRLYIETDSGTYSFEAHGEQPRPSMLGCGLSAAGKHWSSRDPDIKIEKHTAIQDIAAGDGVFVWYTQELLPDGQDYKLSKNAKLYIGDCATGEDRLLYKGECYGDLCFSGKDLYFNMGNKVAVINTDTGETEVLFKHSGIKKNGIDLHITEKRIFFTHWTKDSSNLMWYDRETKETFDPHIDSYRYYYLDDNTIVYRSTSHTWFYNAETKKKKRLFTDKRNLEIYDKVLGFFGVPAEHFDKYRSLFAGIDLEDCKNGRLYFSCHCSFYIKGAGIEATEKQCHELGLPSRVEADVSASVDLKDIRIEVSEKDIVRKDEEYHYHDSAFPCYTLKAKKNKEN